MSAYKALQRKRKKAEIMLYKNQEEEPIKLKKLSQQQRIIIFVNEDGSEDMIKISSQQDFCDTIRIYKFEMPYYIKEGKEIILSNSKDEELYFNSGYKYKIYNYKYYTFFSKNTFVAQINSYEDKLSYNMKEIFFNKDDFVPIHLKSYTRLKFKNVLFNFYNFRDTVYDHKALDVIELFVKSGIGITTHLFLFFLNYRKNIRPKERFIPFLIINYSKLKTSRSIAQCYLLLNFAIVTCFIDFEEYEKYSTKLYKIIKEKGINNIENIILEIIKDICNIYTEKDYFYRPSLIIDRYSFAQDKNEIFKSQLYNNCVQLKYTLFIVYSMKEKKTNEILYKYLSNNNERNYMFSFTSTLYYGIEKLPSKFGEVYSKIYPKISNYLNIQNCECLNSAQKIIENEKNEINDILAHFYETKELKYFYINQIINIKNKIIDVNKNKDLFLNIPFEIVDFGQIENENEKIYLKIKSAIAQKLFEEISNNSILLIIKNPLFNKLNNCIKSIIFTKVIIQLIRDNKTPFGKFPNIYEIDCFLNEFKNNKEYDFKEEKERISKIQKTKYFQKLKAKYLDNSYDGKPILIIPFISNAKEWDLGFIIDGENEKKELCIIQISINKLIQTIQMMMKNFENKSKYIITKIKELYGMNINNINILFILSKKHQNKDTIDFMKKYKIPFIYFNYKDDQFHFLNKKYDEITDFKFGIKYYFFRR